MCFVSFCYFFVFLIFGLFFDFITNWARYLQFVLEGERSEEEVTVFVTRI